MRTELFSERTKRELFISTAYHDNIAQVRRQRVLSGCLMNWFTPKHYPSIFFDQRLKTKIFD
ncbi:hypothetical protein ACFL1I_04140 [Candidatus Omnitrophota bacterium]